MKGMKRLLITIAVAIGIAAGLYGGGYFYYSSHFFPGSMANGVDISGMTAKEAEEAACAELDAYTLTIYGKDTTDTITASDAGMEYDLGDEEDYIASALENQETANWIPALIKKDRGVQVSLASSYSADKTAEAVRALSCVSPEEDIESQDAYYEYADGQYSIIPEVEGNTADEGKVYDAVCEALDDGVLEVSVIDYYPQPSITSDDETLNAIVNAANLILSSDITVTTAYHTATLDADTIQTFLVIDEGEGTVDIDEDLVSDWVNENISGPNYTVGTTRTISTPSSGEVTVSGGTYGNWVNLDEETAQVISELEEGAEVEREPVYRISEKSSENGGVGYTYIDVNISEQMVYLVEDNEVTYSTKCVTGNVSAGNSTPKGTYYVSWKTTNWYMKSFSLTVNYWMPIDDSTGVGLHDATWRSSFGGSIYKTNGSHGCINLSLEAAKYLYNNTEVGIPVIVH